MTTTWGTHIIDTDATRDLLMTAAVFGFAGVVWFGWAQERPPHGAAILLGVGSGVGILQAIGFGLLSWRHWGEPSALGGSDAAMRHYLVVVGVEFALAAAGGLALGLSRWSSFVPVWILFVIGGHFIALAPVFAMPALHVLAVVLMACAVGTLVGVARFTGVQPSFLAGMRVKAPATLASADRGRSARPYLGGTSCGAVTIAAPVSATRTWILDEARRILVAERRGGI